MRPSVSYNGSVSTTKDVLRPLLDLPAPVRAELAHALLDSVEGPDFAEGMTPEEFRAEIQRRIEHAVTHPDDGEDWQTVRDALLADTRG